MAENSNSRQIDYVVLRPADGHWELLGTWQARNASHAAMLVARELAPEQLERGVELRAVPARSWEAGRAQLKAKTETRIVAS